MSAVGAHAFARYAYPPNELGYCGPEGARAMLVPGAVDEIGRRARQFEGAWVYLEFLADALGIPDPLDAAVVEAYWVGSDLLDGLDPSALVTTLNERFAGQVGGSWREAAARARPHHSFQVFEVYPWAGILKQGLAPGPAVNVLDRCRIRVGVVDAVDGESITVTNRQLGWDGQSLTPGEPVTEQARWSVDGLSLLDPPSVGDRVALHWDWVCDVLSDDQAARIEALEAAQRAAVGLT